MFMPMVVVVMLLLLLLHRLFIFWSKLVPPIFKLMPTGLAPVAAVVMAYVVL